MASLSTAYPLFTSSSTSTSSNTHASPVRNSSNEVVVAVDGQGLSIHNVAPNRVILAYSLGLDSKFLCPPISVRTDSETTTTWFLYMEKGDRKLVCWSQHGVNSMEYTISVSSSQTSVGRSLIAFDESSAEYVLVSSDNSHLECYKNGQSEYVWELDIPWKIRSLETFKAKDCPLTQKHNTGLVLLAVSEHAYFLAISPENAPSTKPIITVALPKTTTKTVSVSFDKHTGAFFQLSRKELEIIKPNQDPLTFQLSEKYRHIHPLSQSYVLLSSSTNLIIYDIIYGTIQATLSLPNTLTTLINTPNPLSLSAIITSESQPFVFPITIPESATLLAAISMVPPSSNHHTKHPPILLAPKLVQKFKKETISTATKQLFASLKSAADSSDPRKFDKLFKEYRGTYNIYRRGPERRRTRLTPQFVQELLALLFSSEGEKLAVRIYPEQTVKFLLDVDAFSRDLVPGGGEGFVGAVVGQDKFLKVLLEKEPTVFRYEDYLILVKYTLETPETTLVVAAEDILDAFERDADTFFEPTDMKTVLSLDQLQQLIVLLTKSHDILPYPTILSNVLDSIGLASLLLNPALPANLIETLHTTIEIESHAMETCLTTSALLSLILQRQNDVPVGKTKDRAILFNDRKRRLSQTGWVDVVAEEGGMSKQRKMWMKKPPLPGSGVEMTHRFVATSKFQEVASYTLDRMIMD